MPTSAPYHAHSKSGTVAAAGTQKGHQHCEDCTFHLIACSLPNHATRARVFSISVAQESETEQELVEYRKRAGEKPLATSLMILRLPRIWEEHVSNRSSSCRCQGLLLGGRKQDPSFFYHGGLLNLSP